MVFSEPGSKAIVFENSWNHTFMVDMLNVSGVDARVLVCEDIVDEEFERKYASGSSNADKIRRNRDMVANSSALVAAVNELLMQPSSAVN
jgi:hypothetical protein